MQTASRFGLPRLTSFVRKMMIALFGCYVAQLVLEGWLDIPVSTILALQPGGPGLWQLLTYVLVEGQGPFWFLLGLLFLWWVVAPFELAFGPRRTLQLCIAVALAASVPAYLLGVVVPGSPPLFGTGPVWFGAIGATAWLYRDRQMSFFGMFPMSSMQLLGLLVGFSTLQFLFSHNHTHFIANLGALAGGIAFIRWLKRAPTGSRSAGKKRKARGSGSGLRVIKGGRDDDDPPKWLN